MYKSDFFPVGLACMSKLSLHRKSFLGVKYLWDCHKVWIIYCTLMARSTNWKSKIKRCCCSYLHLQHESVSLYSCDTVGPVQFCGSTISELLCVKIRLPNASPPAVINLIQYDPLTCFRVAIDLWSPAPSFLSQRWIGRPINCAPINHSSPMFVCRSLWYD